jgi:hypothetical protein
MAEEAAPDETIVVEVPADDSPEAGIEALRQQMLAATEHSKAMEAARDEERRGREAERQAREEAERRAQQSANEIANTRRSAADAQYDSVINALAAAQGDLDKVKQAYKTAMSEGDFDKAADHAAEIGLTAARVREFEAGKAAIEQRRMAPPQDPQPANVDEKEAYIRTMPPRTAAWLRRNDRFFTDSNFRRMVQGAHGIATGRGIAPESDEYFNYIEEQAGLRQPQEQQTATAAAPASLAATTTARSSPALSAPAAGSTAAVTRSATQGSITLSPEEREYCRRDGITEAAYAAQKAKLLADGLIGVGH